MKSLNEFLNERNDIDLRKGNDADFLKKVWGMSLEKLEKLLKKSESLNTVSDVKGIMGSFDRRDILMIKSRKKFLKDIIKSKKEKPDYIPNFVK
tara:strand:+ start:2214 stop:2495 length:282 start_codon:yes stop_codon:yes gene_type:complete